jgi:hypothetical protein
MGFGGGIDGAFAVIPETVRSTVIRNLYSLTVIMDSGFASFARAPE